MRMYVVVVVARARHRRAAAYASTRIGGVYVLIDVHYT
eukprot:COSAG02_NODE_4188_length_5646_cov_5.157202_1_plen_37_part_10